MVDRISNALAQPFVLIIVPSRELAVQIYNDAIDLAAQTWISVGYLYGGSSRSDHSASLSLGCDILVATPGRLNDVAANGITDCHPTLNLGQVSITVYDEADELLSDDFSHQLEFLFYYMNDATNNWLFSSQYNYIRRNDRRRLWIRRKPRHCYRTRPMYLSGRRRRYASTFDGKEPYVAEDCSPLRNHKHTASPDQGGCSIKKRMFHALGSDDPLLWSADWTQRDYGRRA